MIVLTFNRQNIEFDTPEDAIAFVARLSNVDDPNPECRRKFVAMKFQNVAQRNAIAKYPVETITQLSPLERDVLYSVDVNNLSDWHKLPPFVHCGTQDTAPRSSVVRDESTVWILNTETDSTLLRSLSEYGVLSVQFR